jgi:DNA invertase Pin-like site-specific DNA recombinase
MFRAGLYARVSTNDQQTLPMQNRAMREYAARRGWVVAMQVREVGSGAAQRPARKKLLEERDAMKSMSCWCGDWIAGAGQSPIC